MVQTFNLALFFVFPPHSQAAAVSKTLLTNQRVEKMYLVIYILHSRYFVFSAIIYLKVTPFKEEIKPTINKETKLWNCLKDSKGLRQQNV